MVYHHNYSSVLLVVNILRCPIYKLNCITGMYVPNTEGLVLSTVSGHLLQVLGWSLAWIRGFYSSRVRKDADLPVPHWLGIHGLSLTCPWPCPWHGPWQTMTARPNSKHLSCPLFCARSLSPATVLQWVGPNTAPAHSSIPILQMGTHKVERS